MSKQRMMIGFLCLFLGLMTACGPEEILIETGEGTAFAKDEWLSGEDAAAAEDERPPGEGTAAADSEQPAGKDGSPETGKNEIVNPEMKETLKDLIYVYVCGQVRTPGVYILDEGSRLFEAVDMAGGVLPEGDLTRINLASLLADGQKVYIPSAAEAETIQDADLMREADMTRDAEDEPTGADDGRNLTEQRVNINSASKETLMTLPGIGEAKADAILAYRQAEGDFESLEALMNVPGIKEGVFAKIKDRIAIN